MSCGAPWGRHVKGPSGIQTNRGQRCQTPMERGRGEVNLSPGFRGFTARTLYTPHDPKGSAA